MAPFRFAVFGDSFVRRQGRFNAAFQFPDHSTVRFFGRGGMSALSIPDDLWKEMLAYRPNICILHLGGNDINPSIDVPKVFDVVMERVNTLRERGIHVVIGEILPRAEFALRERGVPLDLFETVRKGLNKRFRRAMRENWLMFRVCVMYRGGGLHFHYDEDGVHLSESGMWSYHCTLQAEFNQYYW